MRGVGQLLVLKCSGAKQAEDLNRRDVGTRCTVFRNIDRFNDSLTSRFYLLSKNPFMGRRRDADLRVGLRSFPVGEYVILYRIDGEDVLVLHLVRGRPDFQALLGGRL